MNFRSKCWWFDCVPQPLQVKNTFRRVEIQCSLKYSSNDLCMGIRPIVLTAARELRILCSHETTMTEEYMLCFASSTSTMARRAHRRTRAKTAQTSRSAHKCVYMSFTSKPSDSIDTEKRSLSMDKIRSLTRSIEWNSYEATRVYVCIVYQNSYVAHRTSHDKR